MVGNEVVKGYCWMFSVRKLGMIISWGLNDLDGVQSASHDIII